MKKKDKDAKIPEENIKLGRVNWDAFENKFYNIEDGQTVQMVLMDWRDGIANFQGGKEKICVLFKLVSLDGKDCLRVFSVTNQTLARSLRPLCERAEEQGKKYIRVKVSRTGKSFDTRYSVEEICE